jgi:hypothetical protein
MKKIIKKSTTITEMVVDDNGKTYIINRKYNVNSSTETLDKSNSLSSEAEIIQEWTKKDKYFRAEIAKEAEEYKKKNPLPDTSNQKKD